MTTSRLALLLAVLLGGMSMVYLLPHQLGYQPMGVNLGLPDQLDHWTGTKLEVTQHERDVLGEDTEFARENYVDAHHRRVLVSVVLAGQDMMTGLHRPERCLLAQGWSPGPSSQLRVEVPEFGSIPATRLLNVRKLPLQANQPSATLQSVCYYFFVGADKIVGSHNRRVFIDSMDRIWKGYNQRWALVMASGEITSNLQAGGRTEEETDAAVQDVLRGITPGLVKDGVRPE